LKQVTKNFLLTIPKLKKIISFDTSDLKIPKNLRLTVDYPEDLDFARQIYKKLKVNFTYLDILDILEKNNEIIKIIDNLHERWLKNYKKEISKR
jgi:spore coat polysaccharide biosynthesis protein SpsF (cytidylyltransferase family)